jgi:hypothetical protein
MLTAVRALSPLQNESGGPQAAVVRSSLPCSGYHLPPIDKAMITSKLSIMLGTQRKERPEGRSR